MTNATIAHATALVVAHIEEAAGTEGACVRYAPYWGNLVNDFVVAQNIHVSTVLDEAQGKYIAHLFIEVKRKHIEEAIADLADELPVEVLERMAAHVDFYNAYRINPATGELEVTGTLTPDYLTYEHNDAGEWELDDDSYIDDFVNVSSRYTRQYGSPGSMHDAEQLSPGVLRDLAERDEEFFIVAIAYGDEETGDVEFEGWAIYARPYVTI